MVNVKWLKYFSIPDTTKTKQDNSLMKMKLAGIERRKRKRVWCERK